VEERELLGVWRPFSLCRGHETTRLPQLPAERRENLSSTTHGPFGCQPARRAGVLKVPRSKADVLRDLTVDTRGVGPSASRGFFVLPGRGRL
jgi:hypothetical protein